MQAITMNNPAVRSHDAVYTAIYGLEDSYITSNHTVSLFAGCPTQLLLLVQMACQAWRRATVVSM